ncbi:MAG: helix-turn-helix domain-containing protein [Actinomycetota bacterium]|nr:helix-turn-helix domain-containing protein [Actinomycetota bacterium]
MSELGDRLRELRLAAGWSQRKLAAQLGVGFPHVSKIEAGTEKPSDELLGRLADVLGAERDELFLLAQRVPDDVRRQVLDKGPLAVQFYRRWQSGAFTDAQVEKFLADNDEQDKQ